MPNSTQIPIIGLSVKVMELAPYSVPRRVLGVVTIDAAFAVQARSQHLEEQPSMLEESPVTSVGYQNTRVLGGEEGDAAWLEAADRASLGVSYEIWFRTLFRSPSDNNRCWS